MVEAWADNNQPSLIHDEQLPSSFNSGRWKRLQPRPWFCQPKHCSLDHQETTTKVLDPHTQHRPISLEINAAFRPQSFHIRFNFRKANWEKFTADIDSTITDMKTLYMHFDAPPGKPFCVAAEAHTYLVSTNILYNV